MLLEALACSPRGPLKVEKGPWATGCQYLAQGRYPSQLPGGAGEGGKYVPPCTAASSRRPTSWLQATGLGSARATQDTSQQICLPLVPRGLVSPQIAFII